MPVGTQGTVKAMSQRELAGLGYRLILGNTYHLHLRPGEELIRRAGGLHGFIGWEGAILTDSGGFQVYSLRHRRTLTEEGAWFRSHVDGSERVLTPESVVEIQQALGSDILMAFDECPPHPAPREEVVAAMERTHRWAARAAARWRELREAERPRVGALFGIVQGGVDLDLRTHSAAALAALELPGYAIGGVSVGEPKEAMLAVTAHTAPLLPPEKPRYLMGVGTPEDLLDGIRAGVDLFDCVLPSRLGRNGSAYTAAGRVNLKNARFAGELGPVDPACHEWCCREHSAAYVRHLYRCDEILAARVLSYHNLAFYARLMAGARAALEADRFLEFRREFLEHYRSGSGEEEAGADRGAAPELEGRG